MASSCCSRVSFQLVSTVTASNVGTLIPAWCAAFSAADCAARSASLPAQAWTVISSAPSNAARLHAPAMVAGMSWNLRSRNTRRPSALNCATTSGPACTYSSSPTFTQRNPSTCAANVSAWSGAMPSRATMIRSAGSEESDGAKAGGNTHPILLTPPTAGTSSCPAAAPCPPAPPQKRTPDWGR